MRALKLCGVALASGLLVGVLVGWHVGRTWAGGGAVLWETSAAAGYGQLVLLQCEQADTEHARQALLGFTSFSRSISKLHSAQGDKALLADMGRTYLRLAAIEQLAGNSSLAHQYVLSAQQTFKSIGRDIPEAELNKQVTKIASSVPPNSPPS
jgi:hypothetical protein